MDQLKLGRYQHYKGKLYEVLGMGQFVAHNDSDEFIGTGYHSEDVSKVQIYLRDESFVLEGNDDSGLEFVVYQALYNSEEFGNNAWWVRSLSMFNETTEVNGEVVPRFRLID